MTLRRTKVPRATPLHAVLACHNRRDLTVRAITTFASAAKAAGVDADFTVFDDGSTDGTPEALAALELPVTRIAGDGSAFWARSMAEAESHVLHTFHDDGYVVWLNDDVEVDHDAVEIGLREASRVPSAVLVGAMRDPDTGQVTYTGYRSSGFHPFKFIAVEPNGTLQSVDTFNGNLVFVPMMVARALGGIDGGLSHSGADIDYGIRVRDGGFELLLLPRVLGSCGNNLPRPRGALLDDWRAFVGIKGGGNYNMLKRILQKRHPRTWLGFILVTYSLWWLRRLVKVAQGRASGFSSATQSARM